MPLAEAELSSNNDHASRNSQPGSTLENKTITDKHSAKTTSKSMEQDEETKNSNALNLAPVASKLPDYFEIDYNDLEIYEKCGRGSYGMVGF
jgi:hypothetical protein